MSQLRSKHRIVKTTYTNTQTPRGKIYVGRPRSRRKGNSTSESRRECQLETHSLTRGEDVKEEQEEDEEKEEILHSKTE
jgi:hypothetical protein